MTNVYKFPKQRSFDDDKSAPSNRYQIFGSGDPETEKLLTLMRDLDVPVDFHDIRDRDRISLTKLNERMKGRVPSIPWVVSCSGQDIGGPTDFLAHIDSLNKPATKRRRKQSKV